MLLFTQELSALYRSTRGDVACAQHAPLLDASRWTREGWVRIPSRELEADLALQCHRCMDDAGAPPLRHPPQRKPLVLNVDDRPASLYARERVLKMQGCVVVNARTGGAALAAAQRLQPSLILLDVHLPDGDGREICRQIKADATVAHIPVVLISATLKGHAAHLDGIRWAGANGYVTEPFDSDTLASMLRKVLTRAA